MGYRPRILVCEHDPKLRTRLSESLDRAGFWADTARSAREALKKLGTRQYAAMTLNLLLADQDALSLTHELRVLGLHLPVLVISVRAESRRGPRLTRHPDVDSELSEGTVHPEPDWVRKAADQARAIFAVKTACQRLRGFRPRILHVEADRFSAGLVKAALRGSVDLVQASHAQELDHALDEPCFDLALLNPALDDIDGDAILHRIAALCPETPIVMRARCALHSGGCDIHVEGQNGPSVVTALRTLMLHALQVPQRAQA
ncbi:MAG: response regulator [Gammaproteobacteria bacterium]|jgi:DNA-binding response OmpR family regulator|nr:response regulator [Gammaproteobacteria bacterium]